MFITRRAEFSASHLCALPGLSEAENRRIYGAASNPHGHGHNYIVEVTLQGEPDPVTGMIYDLKLLKNVLNEAVIEPMDHRFLNFEVTPFQQVVPTAENLAVEIWNRLQPRFSEGPARLHSIRLHETEDLYVEYAGEAG